VRTTDIYRGVAPFIAIQLLMLLILALWPAIATWLPAQIYG
jgi:TRAP-type mannitol/chloroaromatic compound transport system permease large subunit